MEEFVSVLTSRDALVSIGAGLATLGAILAYLFVIKWRSARQNESARPSSRKARRRQKNRVMHLNFKRIQAIATAEATENSGEADGEEEEKKEAPKMQKELESILRDEISFSIQGLSESITQAMAEIVRSQQVRNDAFQLQLGELSEQRGEDVIERALSGMSQKLETYMHKNNARMEEMMKIVDFRLDATLEQRFDVRFQKVSEQMDQLTQGIEDVRALSKDVCDLRQVLSGSKSGSILGEAQLGMLLSDILTTEQYEENKRLREDGERVAFAVKIPGRTQSDATSYLPIDAKFSKEASTQLFYAVDGGDPEEIEAAWVVFEEAVMAHARRIEREFIHPPLTTDFAVAFFPSDGLYAQAIGRPTLASRIQDESNVLLAGPSTLTALLNSLQMGFRTIAIERRSEEVWVMLGAVRGEFVNFADALSKTQKWIAQASDAVEDAARRSRIIEEKLKSIETFDKVKQKDLYAEAPEEDAFMRELLEDWD